MYKGKHRKGYAWKLKRSHNLLFMEAPTKRIITPKELGVIKRAVKTSTSSGRK